MEHGLTEHVAGHLKEKGLAKGLDLAKINHVGSTLFPSKTGFVDDGRATDPIYFDFSLLSTASPRIFLYQFRMLWSGSGGNGMG